jgi:succinoglycan biosynthesis transport protein ExoP
MDSERELTLNDYLNIVKRKFPYVVIFFCLAFFAVVVFAIWISPVYQATATILIESQQVRPDQAKEKYAADRFAALNQVVLSKDNLLKIAERYKLYGLDKKPDLSHEFLINATRGNVSVERLRAEPDGWEGAATFAFNVSFTHYNADETYKITNDFVKLFLDENDRVSKEQVIETADFFSNEEAKRRAELEKIEKEVSNYKRLYADSLPENKEMYVGSLERLENDLRATQREYSATQSELRSLDVSLESVKAGVGLGAPQDRVVAPTDLDGLRLELAKQKSIYNDNHPAVRVLQRRIEQLEKNAVDVSGKTEPAKNVTPQSVMVAKVQAQIDTANSRLKSLRDEEASIRAKISQTEGRVMRSSQTEGALGSMMREYENAKAAYADIKAKLDNSKIAKNIEMGNKGERFVLIEAPVFPDKPIKPNRILIIVAGFFGAIAFAIVMVILMETFDTRIRGVEALATIMKIQPMATIPYITNKAEIRRKKYIVVHTLLAMFALAILALAIVHFFAMPLDVLLAKIIARF